ncbi:MAG: hypothetical protein ACREBS_09855, partial [Nitrososphaerales archaeon]
EKLGRRAKVTEQLKNEAERLRLDENSLLKAELAVLPAIERVIETDQSSKQNPVEDPAKKNSSSSDFLDAIPREFLKPVI